MTESLSASIQRTLSSASYNAVVVDAYGAVLFSNSRWNANLSPYGLAPQNWLGTDFAVALRKLLNDPEAGLRLQEAMQSIISGERLGYSAEYALCSPQQGSRMFRLEVCPLISDSAPCAEYLILSLTDAGPVPEIRHIPPAVIPGPAGPGTRLPIKLLPICASCKSIRNNKEEWVILEHFLQQQLSVQFTHDICPDCIRQLYPKYAGVLKM
ncbi:hypothetical protein [Paenibacillus donghaensis]|uniref:PAS fold-4 domain-containing protein n=1 Tax=Paenibacillus donghaensis TaxID=414771 RepID=A0A2Z2K2Z2_9BACL|nr:hypothetical protein [Paenibacillus donghaensis]ASA19536.1 hypothetical protein B9T62_01075 [Paenibacillus donghaensis]